MTLIDDSALIHGREYDPEYARRYYLRTRKLKGRVRKATDSTKDDRGLGRMKDFDADKGEKYFNRSQKLAGRLEGSTSLEKEAEERLVALKAKLDRLQEELRKLVAQAKARSGVKPPSTPEEKSSSAKTSEKSSKKSSTEESSKDSKPLTVAQKREKAKADAERYDKAMKENRTTAEQIQAVQEKIENIRETLKNATARAREQAQSKPKTASNGR